MSLLRVALLLLVSITACANPPSAEPVDPEVAAFNRSVTDAEIEAYLRFLIQYDAEQLREWDSGPAQQRATKVAEYRQLYETLGQRMSVLRDQSPQELHELDVMAQFSARASIKLRQARERLPKLELEELRSVRDSCIALMQSHPGVRTSRNVRTPPTLDFLEPDLVRINRHGCTVFLQKGMGEGYGLEVRKVGERWHLYRFDDYLSWDREEVVLD